MVQGTVDTEGAVLIGFLVLVVIGLFIVKLLEQSAPEKDVLLAECRTLRKAIKKTRDKLRVKERKIRELALAENRPDLPCAPCSVARRKLRQEIDTLAGRLDFMKRRRSEVRASLRDLRGGPKKPSYK